MRHLTPELLREASDLIRQLRSGEFDDDALSGIVSRLNTLLPDPEFMAYTVDHVPELTPEEVVRKAFEYRPIIVGWSESRSRSRRPENNARDVT